MKIKLKKGLQQPQKPVYDVLCWHDSPTVNTGFGTVARNIMKHLYSTGEYRFDIVGINFHDAFYDKEKYPYEIRSAHMFDRKDVYGNITVLKSLTERDYDILFVMNDTFATAQVVEQIKKIREDRLSQTGNTFKIIYYYPVDCSIQPEWTSFIRLADFPVAYTEFGKIKTRVHDIKVDHVIYHGTDIEVFRKISRRERIMARQKLFQIEDDETFLWMNVNRNSIRKNVSSTILAFKEFKKEVPNSKLYLHMAPSDGTYSGGIEINLLVCLRDLGLELGRDVLFPQGYKVGTGVPDEILNTVMNCADGAITTTTSEGFGLSTPEFMSVGVPVVVPNNTSFPEIVGSNGDRGYVYQCKERTVIDSCGYRKVGRTEDIVRSMMDCCKERGTERQKQIINRAYQFTRVNTWENIVRRQWVPLFKEARSKKAEKKGVVECL